MSFRENGEVAEGCDNGLKSLKISRVHKDGKKLLCLEYRLRSPLAAEVGMRLHVKKYIIHVIKCTCTWALNGLNYSCLFLIAWLPWAAVVAALAAPWWNTPLFFLQPIIHTFRVCQRTSPAPHLCIWINLILDVLSFRGSCWDVFPCSALPAAVTGN